MSSLSRPLLLLAIVTVAAPAIAAAPAEDAEDGVYAELAALEARVAAIGFRLTTANAGWCPVRQAQFGWIWGDPRLYDDRHRSAALAAYRAGTADLPFLAAVVPGSPVEVRRRAHLRVGFRLTKFADPDA